MLLRGVVRLSRSDGRGLFIPVLDLERERCSTGVSITCLSFPPMTSFPGLLTFTMDIFLLRLYSSPSFNFCKHPMARVRRGSGGLPLGILTPSVEALKPCPCCGRNITSVKVFFPNAPHVHGDSPSRPFRLAPGFRPLP